MLQVRITQNFGRIGINQSFAFIKVDTAAAGFKVSTEPGAVRTEIEWPEVHIDQTRTRASMGYKPVVLLQKDIAEKGRHTVLQGIRRTVREGDLLGKIEKAGNPVPEIAEKAVWPEQEFNVAVIPKVPPDITVSGRLDVEAVPGDIKVESDINFPQITAFGPKVDVYLKVKPELNIEVTGQWIDLRG